MTLMVEVKHRYLCQCCLRPFEDEEEPELFNGRNIHARCLERLKADCKEIEGKSFKKVCFKSS